MTERFATDSAVGGGERPEEFAACIARQHKVWSQIVERAGIKPDGGIAEGIAIGRLATGCYRPQADGGTFPDARMSD